MAASLLTVSPHPAQEVEDLVKCHADNPVAKFFNACGQTKLALDFCFKEEKVLRRALNKRVSTEHPAAIRPITPSSDAAAPAR